jgi:hypothetical protein
MTNKECAKQLDLIRDNIIELLNDAELIVRDTSEGSIAQTYWIGHIKSALGDDDYKTYSTTMRDSIRNLNDGDDA